MSRSEFRSISTDSIENKLKMQEGFNVKLVTYWYTVRSNRLSTPIYILKVVVHLFSCTIVFTYIHSVFAAIPKANLRIVFVDSLSVYHYQTPTLSTGIGAVSKIRWLLYL